SKVSGPEVIKSCFSIPLLRRKVVSHSIARPIALLRGSATDIYPEFLTERQIVMTGDAAEIAGLIQGNSGRAELICYQPLNRPIAARGNGRTFARVGRDTVSGNHLRAKSFSQTRRRCD